MSSRRSKPRKQTARPLARATPAPKISERRQDGRLHLELVVDPATGRDRLDLLRPVFREDWQNRLTAAAANTAYAIVRDERSVTAAARLGKSAMNSTSTLVGGLLERAPPGAVACRSGCDHCCYQSVGVTAPEALAIVVHLQETLPLAELDALRAALRAFAERIRGLTSEERVSPDLPCPFLRDHACSIYEVRPLVCRGVTSVDAEACRRHLHEPSARAASTAAQASGHLLLEPLRAFHAISAGLQLGLAECFGLDLRPLDLVLALDLLLADGPSNAAPAGAPNAAADGAPNAAAASSAVAQEWLDGKPSLISARGGDASADPQRLELAGAAQPGDAD